MSVRTDWLAGLARLGTDDLRRISRLVDLLTVADRASADLARTMLDAQPEPETFQEARKRLSMVIEYLEQAGGAIEDQLDATRAGLDDEGRP